jgi:hypothetical protein
MISGFVKFLYNWRYTNIFWVIKMNKTIIEKLGKDEKLNELLEKYRNEDYFDETEILDWIQRRISEILGGEFKTPAIGDILEFLGTYGEYLILFDGEKIIVAKKVE